MARSKSTGRNHVAFNDAARSKWLFHLLWAAITLALCACGGGGGGGAGSGGVPNPPSGPGTPNAPTAVTVGGTVSGLAGSELILQNNGGDDLAITANGAFVFRSTMAAGSAYRVSVSRRPANPLQTCVVTNGSGTTGVTNVTDIVVECRSDQTGFIFQYEPLVSSIGTYVTNEYTGQLTRVAGLATKLPQVSMVHPQGRLLYLIADGEDVIRSYGVDRASGALTEIGAPVEAGPSTRWGQIHPNGKFIYLANASADRIARFAIRDDGSLEPLSPVTLPTGSFPGTAVMTSDGRYLVVGNTGPPLGDSSIANVTAFVVDAQTGDLTVAPGSPVATSVPPEFMYLAGRDSYLYLLPVNSTTTTAFRLDAATGALMSIPAPLRSTPIQEAVAHPGLPFMYWAPRPLAGPATQLEAVSLDPSTGQLVPVPGSSQDIGDEVIHLWIAPSGKFLIAYARQSVVAFAIDPQSGRLFDRRVISGPRFHLDAIKVHTRSSMRPKFVYTANDGASNLSAFAVDNASGALSAIGTSLPARGRTLFMALDSRARFLYTGNIQPEVVYGYSIGADGQPTPMSLGGAYSVQDPVALTMDLSDRFLFVSSSRTQQVYVLSIDPTSGALAFAGAAPTPYAAGAMALHPDGRKLYVLNGVLLSIFGVAPTGQLTRELDRVVNGRILKLHPNGRFLYVVSSDFPAINTYASDMPANVAPQVVAVNTGVYAIEIDPTGRFAYVGSGGRILGYSIDGTAGALTPLVGSPFPAGTLSPTGLSFDVRGQTLYVSNSVPDGVTAFAVDGRTGALTAIGSRLPTPDFPRGIIAAGIQE